MLDETFRKASLGQLWTSGTGDNIYRENGNVGIGTTSPGAKFVVREQAADTDSIGRIRSDEGSAYLDLLADTDLTAGDFDVAVRLGTEGEWEWCIGLDSSDSDKLIIGYDSANVGTNPVVTIDQSGKVGVGTTAPSAKLAVNGGVNVGADSDPGDNNLYVVGDCSALTFTDRTSFYEGDVLEEIKKIRGRDGKIDHSTLPEFVKSQIILVSYLDPNDPNEIIEQGRNLGNMVTMLTIAVQQLTERIEELEK